MSKFHVITSLSNPIRFHSRYRLYNNWVKHMHESGVNPWTVEVGFGDRRFHTPASNPRNLHLRSVNELWLKENALNLLVQRLPDDWEYVAWIDADIDFLYPCWLEEAWHQLQHYEVIQLWQSAIDMDHCGTVLQTHTSFMYCYLHNLPYAGKYGTYWHSGYAWACSRKAWNGMGGLLDFAICGSADHNMASCLIGRGERSIPPGVNPKYADKIMAWQSHAVPSIKKDVGYIPTTIRHHFHGVKRLRQYWTRNRVLIDSQFDPDFDVKRDHHGLWQLTDRNWKLRDDLRAYFRSRKEDLLYFDEPE